METRIDRSKFLFAHLLVEAGFNVIWIEGEFFTYETIQLPNPSNHIHSLTIAGKYLTPFIEDNHTMTTVNPRTIIDVVEKQMPVKLQFDISVKYINFT